MFTQYVSKTLEAHLYIYILNNGLRPLPPASKLQVYFLIGTVHCVPFTSILESPGGHFGGLGLHFGGLGFPRGPRVDPLGPGWILY